MIIISFLWSEINKNARDIWKLIEHFISEIIIACRWKIVICSEDSNIQPTLVGTSIHPFFGTGNRYCFMVKSHMLGWNPWLFGRWNPKCLLLKTTLDTSFSCLNPRKFIQFLHQTISNLHFWLASTPNFPWFSHIFATSMLELRRDARPVVAQWTARCPCERPPNTTMHGLAAEFLVVFGSMGAWLKWQTWRCYQGFFAMDFLYDVLDDLNGEWNLKGFQWSVEWRYIYIYGEYNDNVMGYAKKIPTSNDPWSSCVARR